MDKNPQKYWLHIILFIASVFTTLMAGSELALGKSWMTGIFEPDRPGGMAFSEITDGILYSFAFLTFLTFHEFGHYFTAVYHKVKCSLPYYIPIFIPFSVFNIGSFGAVIRIRQIPSSTKKFFDIGIAGPLAGFVVSILLLAIGFSTLPPLEEKIYNIHPDYEAVFGRMPSHKELQYYPGPRKVDDDEETGAFHYEPPGGYMMVGSNLMFEICEWAFVSDPSRVPPNFEMMHYPLLFVGFLTLFFTALNLLPIGQLDGGHVVYGLFGRKNSGIISRVTVVLLMAFGGTGFVEFSGWEEIYSPGLYLMFLLFVFQKIFGEKSWHWPLAGALGLFVSQGLVNYLMGGIEPSAIWLIYSFLAVRFVGLDHPLAQNEHPLDTKRKILGWLAILIFILCFSPNPIFLAEGLMH